MGAVDLATARKNALALIEEWETVPYKFNPGYNGSNGTVGGYFASYARKRDLNGRFNRRGFLTAALRDSQRPILLLYGHDYNQPLGFVTRIEERQTGLYMRAEYFNTPRAQEIRRLVCMGHICQLSFKCCPLFKEEDPAQLSDTETAQPRPISELIEISITDNPAQPMSIITDYS